MSAQGEIAQSELAGGLGARVCFGSCDVGIETMREGTRLHTGVDPARAQCVGFTGALRQRRLTFSLALMQVRV